MADNGEGAEAPAPPAEAPPAEAPAEARKSEPPAAAPAPAETPAPSEPVTPAASEAPAPAAEARASATPAPAAEARAPSATPAPAAEAAPADAPPEAPAEAPAAPKLSEAPKAAIDSGTPRRDSSVKTSFVDQQQQDIRKSVTSQMRAFSKQSFRKHTMRQSSIAIKQRSMIGAQLTMGKVPRYMNSYKLNADNPFNPDKVRAIIEKVLTDQIADTYQYDPTDCALKVKQLSSLLRGEIKSQDYDRYKIVCMVTIGEKKSYDIFTGVRFLWDQDRDKYATYMHENMHIFCVASVFGFYFE